MTSNSKIILGLLAAAAAGAAMGVLLAPGKGSEFRKKIKNTASGWANDLAHLFELEQNGVEKAYATNKVPLVDRVKKGTKKS